MSIRFHGLNGRAAARTLVLALALALGLTPAHRHFCGAACAAEDACGPTGLDCPCARTSVSCCDDDAATHADAGECCVDLSLDADAPSVVASLIPPPPAPFVWTLASITAPPAGEDLLTLFGDTGPPPDAVPLHVRLRILIL
jgi:hypothetical protein